MTIGLEQRADNLLKMAAMVRDRAVEIGMDDVAETPLPELALMIQEIIRTTPKGKRVKMLGITLH
jgi:hypothetical protein